MNTGPFQKNETANGRWEILDHSTKPAHAVGATSWPTESDVDFWLGHLNNAFLKGARAGANFDEDDIVERMAQILGVPMPASAKKTPSAADIDSIEVRAIALKEAGHLNTELTVMSSTEIISAASAYENFLLGKSTSE